MITLLEKLRINYVTLTMVTVKDKPQEATIQMHRALIDTVMEDQETDTFVSESERIQLEEKTNRQLRLRELLLQYSKNASLIVLSMPIPRKVKMKVCSFKLNIAMIVCLMFLGNRVRTALHVLAGDVDERYAPVPVGSRKPNFGADLLFISEIHLQYGEIRC